MIELRILGPLEVVHAETGPVALGGQKQRSLLALLVLNRGDVVSVDGLVDKLWGEQPPRTATTALHNAVSQLRRLIGQDLIVTRAPGYVLVTGADTVDSARFERLVRDARRLPVDERARALREALALWRGSPLADFAFEDFAQSEIHRLEELRTTVLEERIDAELELGLHQELIGELESLVQKHPRRERLLRQLMLALYRSGRQAEALQVYQDERSALDEDGIEPSPELRRLHTSILRQESELDPTPVSEDAAPHYDEIVEAVLAGRLVPVLGAGVNLCVNGGRDHLPQRNDLAAYLADVFECPPEHAGDLTKVAQYVTVTRGVGPLYDELHAVFDRDFEPGPVHRFLAALPAALRERGAPQQLIVTTNYDRALERALEEAGEAYDIVSYVSIGRDRGKFVHVSADGGAEIIHVPNAYLGLPLDERPVILKVHGQVDREPARESESFVVSEDDYIGFLAQTTIAGALPVTLAAKLRRSHFLFLGYGVLDWSLRVFLQRVWPDEQVSYRSWAVQPSPGSVERQFWRSRGVDLFDASCDEYVGPLGDRVAVG